MTTEQKTKLITGIKFGGLLALGAASGILISEAKSGGQLTKSLFKKFSGGGLGGTKLSPKMPGAKSAVWHDVDLTTGKITTHEDVPGTVLQNGTVVAHGDVVTAVFPSVFTDG